MHISEKDIERRCKKLALTPEQQKAWRAFKRAVKQCEKTGVEFYTNLETIHALNGRNLVQIHDGDGEKHINMSDVGADYIGNHGFVGWADDIHYAEIFGE